MKDINLANFSKFRNQKQQGYINVSGTNIKLPITIICGKKEGKTVLITGGVHCAEYVGIETAIELSKEINLEDISGNIIIVPLINRSGFENRTMSVVYEDGKNLNRVFPGNEQGSVSEKIAYFMEKELFKISDYYIDLHCGDGYEELTPYVYYQGVASEDVTSKSKQMAMAINPKYVVESQSNSGGAYNYAGSIGLPGILIERGCMGKWSKEEVEEYKIDVKNVLKELNVLSGEKVDRNNDTKVITNTIYENSMYTGCWYSNYKVGDIVSKGDELGTVKDYFGNILHTCIAKVDGIILYQVGSLSILKDGPMITYGEI